MRKIITRSFLFSFMCMYGSVFAQETIKLYPQGPLESNGVTKEESFDGRVIANVTNPEMIVFSPENAKNTGAAVLICPGGGYSREAIVHEGYQVAEWLASQGITGVVLKYRLPNGHKEIPLKDVDKAMILLHENAKNLNINPGKIGIAGFSAGGHLASTGGTHLMGENKPDFMILFYPVISMAKEVTHTGSRENLLGMTPQDADVEAFSNEKRVTSQTPPTLLLLSDDDKAVPPLNSILFYNALQDNNVKSAMYIFPVGGHGWGYKSDFIYHETWKQLTLQWLKGIGVIE